MTLTCASNASAVARPQWGIINRAACEVAKDMIRGYAIQKVEVEFKGKAETFTNEAGQYEYTYFTNTKKIEFSIDSSPEDLFDFAQGVKDSYLKLIAELRQNRDLLQLDCKMTIVGAKNSSDTLQQSLEFNGLKGRLSALFWDRVIGTIESGRTVDALTDAPLPLKSDDSQVPLHLRALDLAQTADKH